MRNLIYVNMMRLKKAEFSVQVWLYQWHMSHSCCS